MNLPAFVTESFAIEAITLSHDDLDKMVKIHQDFLELRAISMDDVVEVALKLEPDAILRSRFGMDVIVGCHIPPKGGPQVIGLLQKLIERVPDQSAHKTHIEFEDLHPFMDGNGRTGRLLWLWANRGFMLAPSFLHSWYYESLQYSNSRE